MKWNKDDTTAMIVAAAYILLAVGGYIVAGIGGLLQSTGLALILTAMNRSYCNRLRDLL